MENPRQSPYDIAELLRYTGPSLQQEKPIEDGVMLLDYRSTDENARKIATLLSSQGIPFDIERPRQGWRGQIRLIVTVPRNLLQKSEAVLNAATRVSAIDIVEGLR
jgi:hypothetical protein